jgi:menaquinone-9 beta-reductase
MSYDADVVIVGAGPAGSAAAYHLALRGRRSILLDRSVFPRDKSCGDAVNRAGVDLLDEMKVLDDLDPIWEIGGLSLSMGKRGARTTRDFRYGRADRDGRRYGLVVPRSILDDAMARRAVAVGAEFREGVRVRRLLMPGGVVEGVETGDGARLRAPVVVAADGSTSKLARQAGLMTTPRNHSGYAVRSYFECVEDVDDTLRFLMPLTDPGTRARMPAYGWVIPVGPGRVNVGAGVAERRSGMNLHELFEQFVEELYETSPEFANARPVSPLLGSPLYFGFSPEQSWAPGLILAGDAAGMINPGTGEGISFALESGKIAAQVIDAQFTAGQVADLSAYTNRLVRRFSGHLETGRHAVRRHRLAWRVLEDTFDSDRPIFAVTRRAVLAPDHTAGFETTSGAVDDIRRCLDPRLRLASQLVEVGEILADTVRKDWPFLDRLPALASDEYLMAPRPAMLMLIAARFGDPPPGHLTAFAAAADLAAIAAIAQISVNTEPNTGARDPRPNWGTMFAVLSADLFFARAFELCATKDPELTAHVARAIEDASQSRMRELAADRELPIDERLVLSTCSGVSALCAAACDVGARMVGAPRSSVAALETYGRKIGTAAQLIDDVRRLSGQTDRLGRDALADLESGTPSVPFQLALQQLGADADEVRARCTGRPSRQAQAARLAELIGRTGAVEQSRLWIRDLCLEAADALDQLPDGPARRSLAAIAQQVIRKTENQDLRP